MGFVNFTDAERMSEWADYLYKKPDIEIMQFTGLKDKNGKEIYEGDVVKWGLDEHAQAEVIYSGAGFMLHSLYAPKLAGISIGCEVIGNIYENPELLKS